MVPAACTLPWLLASDVKGPQGGLQVTHDRSNRRPVGQLSRNTENIPRPGGSVLESPAAGGRPPPSVRDSVLATQGSALASCR